MADTVVNVIVRARDEFSKTFGEFQANALDVAKAAGGLAAVSGAAALGLAAISADAGRKANDLQVLGLSLRLNVTEVSALQFAAEQLDVNFGSLTGSISFFQRAIFNARAGVLESVQAFKALGFSQKEIDEGLGGTQEGFRKTIEALRNVSDEGARAGLLFRVFGRSASEIRPIIEGGTAALDEQFEKFKELNAGISDTAGVFGDEFGDAVAAANRQVEALKSAIAESLLPAMTDAVTSTQGFLAATIQFAKDNPSTVRSIFQLSVGFTALFGTIGALLGAVAVLKGALATLGVSAAALAASGGGIALAIIALGALAFAITNAREKAREPLLIKVGIDFSDAAQGGAELARLSRERVKRQAELDAAIAAQEAAKVSRVSPGDVLTGRGNPQQFIDNAKLARDVAEAKKNLDQLDQSIRTAASLTKQQFSDPSKDFKLGIGEAKSALEQFLELLEKASRPKDLTESDIRKLLEPPTELRPPTDPFGKPLPPPNASLTPSPEIRGLNGEDIALNLSEAFKAAEALHEILLQIGVDVKNIDAPLSTFVGTFAAIGEAARTAFKGAFDPLLLGVEDASRAVYDFRDSAIQTLDNSLRSFILNGQRGLTALGDLFINIGQAAGRLVEEIIILTIRTAILKAVTGFLFSAGGSALTGGGGGEFYGPGFAGGGELDATPGGYVRGPGTTTSDSIPARLSDKEFVTRASIVERPGVLHFLRELNAGSRDALAVIGGGGRFASGGLVSAFAGGGYAGGGLTSTHETLRETFSSMVQRIVPIPGAQPPAPLVGSLTIVARDADSVRRDLSQGGRSFRELQRLQDEGRR